MTGSGYWRLCAQGTSDPQWSTTATKLRSPTILRSACHRLRRFNRPLSNALPTARQKESRAWAYACVCRTELPLYQHKLVQYLMLSAPQLPCERLLDGLEKCLQRAVACHVFQLLQPLCLGYSGSPQRARDLGYCVLLQSVWLRREEVANDTSRPRRGRGCLRRACSSAEGVSAAGAASLAGSHAVRAPPAQQGAFLVHALLYTTSIIASGPPEQPDARSLRTAASGLRFI